MILESSIDLHIEPKNMNVLVQGLHCNKLPALTAHSEQIFTYNAPLFSLLLSYTLWHVLRCNTCQFLHVAITDDGVVESYNEIIVIFAMYVDSIALWLCRRIQSQGSIHTKHTD